MLNYSNEHRLLEGRGKKDMEVDALNRMPGQDGGKQNQYTDQEWTEYVDSLRQEFEDVSYVGKGKHGGGKGRKGRKGNNLKGKGKDTRTCHWCQTHDI